MARTERASRPGCCRKGAKSRERRTAYRLIPPMLAHSPRGSGSPFRVERKGEIEDRAPADLRFGPDAAAVTMDDALDGREPDPGPRVVARRMKALKRPEKLVGVAHVEARAIVAYEVGRSASPVL